MESNKSFYIFVNSYFKSDAKLSGLPWPGIIPIIAYCIISSIFPCPKVYGLFVDLSTKTWISLFKLKVSGHIKQVIKYLAKILFNSFTYSSKFFILTKRLESIDSKDLYK